MSLRRPDGKDAEKHEMDAMYRNRWIVQTVDYGGRVGWILPVPCVSRGVLRG